MSEESEGEVALCFIGGVNAAATYYKNDEELEKLYYTKVKLIDNLIDMQEYPYASIENKVKKRRPIGIGLMNLAYVMAKEGVKYSSKEGKNLIHRIMERHTYFLYKASLQLAKERGVPEWISRTNYVDGILPIDTYNKNVDELHDQELCYDWGSLKQEIKVVGGIRNSTVSTIMPGESSSQASGTTNSIYPIRELVVQKKSGDNINVFIAPEADTIGEQYEIAWDVPTKDMIALYAISQKFLDQAISADFYNDFRKNGGSASTKEGLQWMIWMSKYGVKTAYYLNNYTENANKMQEEEDSKGCSGGSCTL